jgi:hypothetical protein
MIEPSEIRKRVLHTLEQSRRHAAAHREEATRATQAMETLLPDSAHIWRVVANVLKAEGHAFAIQTPGGALRLVSDRSHEDFIEVALDTTADPVAVIGRVGLVRGHRHVDREVIVARGDDIMALTPERLLEFLLRELEPFVAR